MDYIVHGVAKSWTQLSDFHFHICTHTLEYYSAMKNKIMSFLAMWMDLEIIILREVSQRQISYDITYMRNF